MATAIAQATSTTPYGAALRRLSTSSVDKHFDAYADVDWDSPELAIDPTDPRFELPDFDPLGGSEWYRSQPPEQRALIGLWRQASCMKIGWHFENLLQRGLLQRAMSLRNGSAEFRYLHHEVIEESQHSLMFQEFVERSGLPVRGMPRALQRFTTTVILPLATRFPSMFFLFVLGGEEPIDHVQRRHLRGGQPHPLVERIMQIHVTEEARHVSFAHAYLRDRVPHLGRLQRHFLAVGAPVTLGIMTRLMLVPSPQVVRRTGIPREVVRAAYRSPAGRQAMADAVARPRRLWRELGLMTKESRLVWRLMGVWDDDLAA